MSFWTCKFCQVFVHKLSFSFWCAVYCHVLDLTSHGTKYIVHLNNSCRCFPRVYLFTVHKEPVYVCLDNSRACPGAVWPAHCVAVVSQQRWRLRRKRASLRTHLLLRLLEGRCGKKHSSSSAVRKEKTLPPAAGRWKTPTSFALAWQVQKHHVSLQFETKLLSRYGHHNSVQTEHVKRPLDWFPKMIFVILGRAEAVKRTRIKPAVLFPVLLTVWALLSESISKKKPLTQRYWFRPGTLDY